MHNVKLVHNSYPHTEWWTILDDDIIQVYADTPYNYPPNSLHVLPLRQALRQLALMASDLEGWEIEDADDVWHSLIDSMETYDGFALAYIIADFSPYDVEETGTQFWSNTLGWVVNIADATTFSEQEKDTYNLPVGNEVAWIVYGVAKEKK